MPSDDIYDFGISGPYEEEGGGLGSGILKALQGGGGDPLATASGLLSMIPVVGPYLSAGLPLVSSIAGLFQTSPEGKNKQTATKLQQTGEQWMQGIEDSVAKGQMDPFIAEEAINNMIASLKAGAKTEQDQHAVAMAGYAAAQHIANIRGTQNWLINTPWQNSQDRFGVVDIGNNTHQALSPEATKARGQSLLQNLLMGTTTGKEFGNATPAGILTQGLTDPGNRYSSYLTQTATANANNALTPKEAPSFASLREAVGGGNAYSPVGGGGGSVLGGMNQLGDKIMEAMKRLGVG